MPLHLAITVKFMLTCVCVFILSRHSHIIHISMIHHWLFQSLPCTTLTPFFFTAAARQLVAPATAATTARPPMAPDTDDEPVILAPWATPPRRAGASALRLGAIKAVLAAPKRAPTASVWAMVMLMRWTVGGAKGWISWQTLRKAKGMESIVVSTKPSSLGLGVAYEEVLAAETKQEGHITGDPHILPHMQGGQ